MALEADGGYRLFPTVDVHGHDGEACVGEEAVKQRLRAACAHARVVVVECYPGVAQDELLELLRPLGFEQTLHSDDWFVPPAALDALLRRELTDDRVFGMMTTLRLEDLLAQGALEAARAALNSAPGRTLVYGVGASLASKGDVLILADVTRWEIQLRYRQGMSNWRCAHEDMTQREKYKRGYFAEWRWADRVKDGLLPRLDFYLDMTQQGCPGLAAGEAYRDALAQTARRPFRLQPYFDPGVWGGHWMQEHFGLPTSRAPYAWSFDGVPEENSLRLDFGGAVLQTPAINLVFLEPRALLGERVFARFGKEFPIRFDMLDTMGGQNLSLQVHPLTEYIHRQFNMTYTQDESYYILDTQGDDACVYLGLKTGVDPDAMLQSLRQAQNGGPPFDAEAFVNRIPVQKHDHLLIPAGTVHASGKNVMVLEISATPYIFTFKLWDWGRVDLDGKPRPIHLDHGAANIQWNRDTAWVRSQLVNAVTPVDGGPHAIVERTGLHRLEFLDTLRYRTSSECRVAPNDSVHMLNLVQGRRALLTGEGFSPFELRYAETCVVPAAAGAYRVVSPEGEEVCVVSACVRE